MNEKEARALLFELGMSMGENGEEEYCEAIDVALKDMEELKQYREIGTVEECLAAVEKMKAKKTLSETIETRKCPICGSYDVFNYCGKCGQKMKW